MAPYLVFFGPHFAPHSFLHPIIVNAAILVSQDLLKQKSSLTRHLRIGLGTSNLIVATLTDGLRQRIDVASKSKAIANLVIMQETISQCDIISNAPLVESILEAENMEDFVSVAILMKSFLSLDELYDYRLSKATSLGQCKNWARNESDKVRLIVVYFVRLAECRLNSHSTTIQRLKKVYYQKTGLRSSASIPMPIGPTTFQPIAALPP